jgi:hypothetical protein
MIQLVAKLLKLQPFLLHVHHCFLSCSFSFLCSIGLTGRIRYKEAPLCYERPLLCYRYNTMALMAILDISGTSGYTLSSCCVARGCSGLAVPRLYCQKALNGYDGVQATAQQECCCWLSLYRCVIVLYGIVLLRKRQYASHVFKLLWLGDLLPSLDFDLNRLLHSSSLSVLEWKTRWSVEDSSSTSHPHSGLTSHSRFCIGVCQHLWSYWSPSVSVHRSLAHWHWHASAKDRQTLAASIVRT